MAMVEPGTREWDDLVQACQRSISERNWTLGDAALRVAPVNDDHGHTGAYDNLRAFAHEVGIEFETLRKYRAVSAAWPDGTRVPSAGWKVHQILMRGDRQHLVSPGLSVSAAERAIGGAGDRRVGPQSSPELRARQVMDSLADPAVRDAIRPMTRERLNDLNAQAIANGGRVTPVAEMRERDRDVLDLIEDLADEDERLRRLVAELKRVAESVAARGPFGEDTPTAVALWEVQSIVMNAIAVTVSR